VKLSEVKPLIDAMLDDIASSGANTTSIRIALEAAFVAGVRSGLKYTSNAKFAEVFGGAKPNGLGGKAEK
jgi:hypothetical protein